MQIMTDSLISLSVEDRNKLINMYHFLETLKPDTQDTYDAIQFTKVMLSTLISGETDIL